MQDKIMCLEASIYENLAKHSKVFNKNTLEYHMWIYLDPEDVRTAFFLGAEEIGPNADNSKIFPDTFTRENECWIRANTEYINTLPGKHTLKLKFVDRFTDTDFCLYASYYIQDDNPEKPYVYMHQEANDGSNPIYPRGFTPYVD